MKKFILTVILSVLTLNALADDDKVQTSFAEQIRGLEQKNGGRIGVAALNTANNQRLGYRNNERFAICSTFKLLLSAAVLSRVDAGIETLDRQIHYNAADMQEYAPITRKHLAEGKMTIHDLNAAVIQYSDNTAANLLLNIVKGPQGLTQYIRSLGDNITRLDRMEPELNSNIAGDQRDTSTPSAMLESMHTLLVKDALSPTSKQRLITWLVGNTTGGSKIRAGLPTSWKIGDKTGAGENGASNDVAIAWPANSNPLLITIYYTDSNLSTDANSAVIAEVAHIVHQSFYPKSFAEKESP